MNSEWLNIEVLTKLSKTDPAICPNKCGHSYKGKNRKAHLKRHLVSECGVPKKFKCNLCFKQFAYNTSLKKHYLTCMKNMISFNNHHFLVELNE